YRRRRSSNPCLSGIYFCLVFREESTTATKPSSNGFLTRGLKLDAAGIHIDLRTVTNVLPLTHLRRTSGIRPAVRIGGSAMRRLSFPRSRIRPAFFRTDEAPIQIRTQPVSPWYANASGHVRIDVLNRTTVDHSVH